MNVSHEEKKQEAIRRLEKLTQKLSLNPHILEYFKDDKLYYSYLEAGGFLGSIDTINYNNKYKEVVSNFEAKHGYLVYHVIETGNTIALLYVSDEKDEWEYEQLQNDTIMAYVFNFDMPEWSEPGDITLSSLQGALIRAIFA